MLAKSFSRLFDAVRLDVTHFGNFSFFSTSSYLSSLQSFCNDLAKRGLVANSHPHGLKYDGFRSVIDLPPVIYAGFDASADTLHVGNLCILNALLRNILHGCKSIGLIGQTTAVAGDPSGRTTTRVWKGRDVVAANADAILIQLKRIASNFFEYYGEELSEKLIFVNNAEWYSKMSLEEFLEVGHKFRVADMHRLAAVKKRMLSGAGVDFSEFSYQNLQAIDWLYLGEKYNCYFQIGGSDQLGNFDAGYDYIRKISGNVSAGLGLTLITDGKGEKLGKSTTDPSASVWLDEKKTSAFAFLQFWRQIPDNEIKPLVRFFSLKPIEELNIMLKEHDANLGKWVAQESLAVEMTRLVHGEEGLSLAQQCSKALFQGSLASIADLPLSVVQSLFGKASTFHVSKNEVSTLGQLADRIKNSKPLGSIVMKQGGLKLNGRRCDDPDEAVNFEKLFFGGKAMTITCWGKRNFQLIVWTD